MGWAVKISDSATTDDTIRLIVDVIRRYSSSPFVVGVSKRMGRDYLRSVFDYVCENVRYQRDVVDHEVVTTPERLIRDGRGDCKKMSAFIGAMLMARNYPVALKVVSYNGSEWAHVYVIVPLGDGGWVTLDPVNDCRYDREVSYAKSKVYSVNKGMELSLLGRQAGVEVAESFISGLGDAIGDVLADVNGIAGNDVESKREMYYAIALSGLGAGEEPLGRKRRKKKTKKEKGEGVLKKLAAAPIRAAFLTLVRLNVRKLATNMAGAWKKDGGAGLSAMWVKFGGKPSNLKKAVSRGAHVELGAVAIATVIALIAAATPILLAVVGYLKKSKSIVDADAKDIESDIDAAPDPDDVNAGSFSADEDGAAGGGGGGGTDGSGAGLLIPAAALCFWLNKNVRL